MRLAVIAISLVAAIAHADDTKQHASELFEQGRALAREGKFGEACEQFAKSFSLDAAPGTELNLGDCHEHLGHLAEAWRHFDHALASFETTHDDRAKFARDRRDALAPKLGIVVVKADPSVHVVIAGREQVSAAEIREHVDPGSIEIRIGDDVRREQVAVGATVVVQGPAPAGASGPPVARVEPVTDGARDRHRVLLAYAAWGGGGVVLAVSLGLGAFARSDYQDVIDSKECASSGGHLVCTSDGKAKVDHAITLANIATGAGIAGLALGVAGTVLYFTAPRERIGVAPIATSNSAGLVVTGSF